MHKPILLLSIDNLKRGGAETILIGILPDLNKTFSVIIVTLSDECDFSKEEIICEKKYSLGFKNKFSLFSSILKLKRIIRKHNPSLIHSHLFYSSLIARIAAPNTIPLFYSLHGQMSRNALGNSKLLLFLERKTIKPNHFPVAVSEHILKDYKSNVKNVSNSFVLKNYIAKNYFDHSSPKTFEGIKELKLVAVGNIKKAKNYNYLIEALEKLNGYKISIDIYGTGDTQKVNELNDLSQKKEVPICLKGPTNEIYKILPSYDLLVNCSMHEGFGMAVVEAMAMGMPLLLSDIPVFHEVIYDNALFFDIKNPDSFGELIRGIFNQKYNLNVLSKSGIEISKKYTKEIYLENLFNIYDSVLPQSTRKKLI